MAGYKCFMALSLRYPQLVLRVSYVGNTKEVAISLYSPSHHNVVYLCHINQRKDIKGNFG